MSEDKDPHYPKYIEAPPHLLVEHKGRPHIYEWPYFTDRSGKTWVLVESAAQEKAALSVPAQAARIQIRTSK